MSLLFRRSVLGVFVFGILCLDKGAVAQAVLPSLSDPAISPDGREIAFASGGDLWTVAASGGEAHLLVTHPATESRPLYSPDGTKLAFVSTRTGAGNIYVLTLATGELMRLTYSDRPDSLDGWSHDGKWIYFTSAVNDIAGQGDIFRVNSSGGTPLEVSHERYLNEFESAPSPDGQQIALIARGISSSQWWRNGHAHIDETEIWLKPVAESGKYQMLLKADAKHAWPMWSADGKTLFYMSDATGAENIWAAPMGAPVSAKALTHFKEGRVLWPSIGDGGKTIVFERNFSIWRMDTASGKAEKIQIALRGLPASPGVTHVTETNFNKLALSPDGKKIAVIAHGEVFAASAKDGGEAQRLTHTPTAEGDPVWSPDSMRLAYRSEAGTGEASGHNLVMYDFATSKQIVLTHAGSDDGEPRWSPDGKSVAYVRNQKELHVLTVPTEVGAAVADRVVASGELPEASVAWSPDNQWIAYTADDSRSFRNVHVVPAAGGESHPVSFLANGNIGGVAWSPDGKYILFDTSQRSEQAQIAAVDLLPHVPKYREDEFRELFRPSKTPGSPTTPVTTPSEEKPMAPAADTKSDVKGDAKAEPKKKVEPVKIVFDGIRDRLTFLPLGLNAQEPVISPDGKTMVFAARAANQQSLYTFPLDELSKEPQVARQLTSSPGRKSDYVFGPDSKEVFYLENGTVKTIALESRTPKTIAVTAPMQIDFDVEKKVVFEEAWETLNRRFYDADFNGHNWLKLHDEWAPYIAGAKTSDELRRDINLLIGELNSSHSGINRGGGPGNGPQSVQVGNLGLRFDRDAYETGKGLIVREVIALGPAAIEGSIKPGDRLLSVNGEDLGGTNVDRLLEDTVGKRVALGIETAGKRREAVVRPVSSTAAVGLLYRQWVEERRALVDKMSGGKLGYVHLADMSDASLQQLYIDLDAQNESKKGVVVDVRNNNGGYINGYALDVFTRQNYLMMTPRGQSPVPSRQNLGQRALGVPTVLVTNESSLSDAEDFTEGYRSLKLGKVVGEPTAGWIIFTGAQPLIDGSAVRVPGWRIQDMRGQTMEMHPRPVDVEVERPLGETETGSDAQLERAVKELLATQ
ncbi:MAG TPA: S41 family peptidase [Edaphobacter sp.]|nr:S41 family peptidase [Edaphobacter sp.]